MEFYVITHAGCEEGCGIDISREEGVLSCTSVAPGCLVGSCQGHGTIARIAASVQGALHVGELLEHGEFHALEELAQVVNRSGGILSSYIDMGPSCKIRVDCERYGEHPFTHVDAGNAVADAAADVLKRSGLDATATFKDADIVMHLHLRGSFFCLGIDYAGFELGKRTYKIFAHRDSIKGTLAYSALRLGGLKEDDVVLVPFCHDGAIAIEAVLWKLGIMPFRYDLNKFSCGKYPCVPWERICTELIGDEQRHKVPVYAFDPAFSNLQAAQKNAKIAGVHKYAVFSRVDSDWLFTKFDERKATLVVTHLPTVFKYRKDPVNKIYDTFFSELHDVLADGARIVVITMKPELVKEHALANGYACKETLEAHAGKGSVWFVKLNERINNADS